MIKDKRKLCEVPLNAFNIETVNGFPFYERYNEFINVFKANGITDFEQLFAQPLYNDTNKKIEWYIPDSKGEAPVKFSNISDDEKLHYEKVHSEVVNRLKTVKTGIVKPIDASYFACAIKYIDGAEDYVYCKDGQIIFGLWGMGLRKGHMLDSVISDSLTDTRVHIISFNLEGKGEIKGNKVLHRRHEHVLDSPEIPTINPAPRYGFVKWLPNNPQGYCVTEDVEFTAVCEHSGVFLISFQATKGGNLQGETSVEINKGVKLYETTLPKPIPDDDYKFVGWEPSIGPDTIVEKDQSYTAVFEKIEILTPPTPPIFHNIHFEAGENGVLPSDYSDFKIVEGEVIPQSQVPNVKPHEGKQFVGWDKSTTDPINEDTTFTAMYQDMPVREDVEEEESKESWYKRLRLWFTGKGCLKWFLWLLIILLLLLLLVGLFRRCGEDRRDVVKPIEKVEFPDGSIGDDNGRVKPITGDDGRLPDDVDRITPPMRDEDGAMPPIESNPGLPDVFANRLFLFLENENDDINAFAQDFKKAYSGQQYQIIGFDRDVKMLVVQIPENERNQIRNTINDRIPNHKFFVFDEEIYELHGIVSDNATEDVGWHLKAIHLKEGWSITQGSKKIKVAVVDDGIDASHDMFKGRIRAPYNVYTQDNRLSTGDGHGTHTAALAAGSADMYDKGVSGVAPRCQLMPVQVFDNKQCPLSALIAGIMYSIHHGADVINVSIGPSFNGLNLLPVPVQEEIAKTQFRNVALLWSRVASIAEKKKIIIVFAAGNDDILSSIPPENRNASSIVVTAVDKRLYPTEFTNYGPCSDVSAPGKNIYSAFPVNSFRSCDGTSMAAPIVSGTIALMKSINKDLTVKQVRNVLLNSGADVYGNVPPMVLVDKALLAVKNGDFTEPRERTTSPVPMPSNPSDDAGGSVGRDPGESGDVGTWPDEKKPVVAADPADKPDYDEIRRLIREYEKRIADLKKLLPDGE